MDFQELVDSYAMAAAVLSVEKTNDGHYGEIRIVRANTLYKHLMGSNYHDNVLYTEVVPTELNFEDFCYRCAVLKQHLHSYADTKSMDVWTDGTYIPLSTDYDTDKLSYFVFYFEFTKKPVVEKLAEVSADAAAFVIKTCINLRGAKNFSESMSTVIDDIQLKTGNSMNARVDRHVNGSRPVRSPFGIVFADLNGLKQCNDSGGHEAGDLLLKDAAELLRKHFDSYEIFRSGGDEFVVLVSECSKEDFEKKVAELRADSDYDSKVSLAIGADWSDDGKNLRLCMHNADEAMYTDKNRFYQDHPDIARR